MVHDFPNVGGITESIFRSLVFSKEMNKVYGDGSKPLKHMYISIIHIYI